MRERETTEQVIAPFFENPRKNDPKAKSIAESFPSQRS
jgi:hypothetical protein